MDQVKFSEIAEAENLYRAMAKLGRQRWPDASPEVRAFYTAEIGLLGERCQDLRARWNAQRKGSEDSRTAAERDRARRELDAILH